MFRKIIGIKITLKTLHCLRFKFYVHVTEREREREREKKKKEEEERNSHLVMNETFEATTLWSTF